MVHRQSLPLAPPAGFERWTSRQTFPTITVKRTCPRERIGLPVVRHADVTHLRMQHSMHQSPFRHSTATDPGTYGQVDKGTQSLCRTPAMFRECGGIDVRIESHGYIKNTLYGTNQIHVLPAGLRRGS